MNEENQLQSPNKQREKKTNIYCNQETIELKCVLNRLWPFSG